MPRIFPGCGKGNPYNTSLNIAEFRRFTLKITPFKKIPHFFVNGLFLPAKGYVKESSNE
jgi:hypothetical protein